jgi:hypothetical protein
MIEEQIRKHGTKGGKNGGEEGRKEINNDRGANYETRIQGREEWRRGRKEGNK